MTYFIIASLIFFAALTLESITSWRAIRGAKKHHPELWEHSGMPTLMGNGDLASAWPLVKYYRDQAYLQQIEWDEFTYPPITDPATLKFANALRGPLLKTYYLALASIPIAGLVLLFGVLFS